MAAVTNPEQYNITAFNANFGLSGGVLFALEEGSTGLYYVVSEFKKSGANSRRFPYQGKIEATTYQFSSTGVTATGRYTLYCAESVNNSGSGGGGGDSQGGSGGGGGATPGSLNFRESTALHTLNAMIQQTPNPTAYTDATVRLLTQKAFEFSQEFIRQAIKNRSGGGTDGGGGDEGGSNDEYVVSVSLNGLAAVNKIVWCTQYPSTGEEGVVYVKLRTVAQGSTEPESTPGETA